MQIKLRSRDLSAYLATAVPNHGRTYTNYHIVRVPLTVRQHVTLHTSSTYSSVVYPRAIASHLLRNVMGQEKTGESVMEKISST
jgi:hypothetical protein